MAQIEISPDYALLNKIRTGLTKAQKKDADLYQKNREEILKSINTTKFSWRQFKFIEKTKEEIEQEISYMYFQYFYFSGYTQTISHLKSILNLVETAMDTGSKVLLTEDDLNIIEAWSK